MPQAQPTLMVPIEVQVCGDDTPLLASHAEQRLRATLHTTDETVQSARIRIVRHRGPDTSHPIVAQANLDLSDRFVRAQVVTASAIEAVAALHDRLQHHLRRVALRRKDLRHSFPSHRGQFRHDSRRPRHFPGHNEKIVRCKSVEPTHRDLDEATFDMEIMDYDFHLFVESGSGQDSVLSRVTPSEYWLAQLQPSMAAPAKQNLPIRVSERPAPRCHLGEAVERLSASGRAFLFFQDAEHGRGTVLYRRYDGHLGLIAPAEQDLVPARRPA